MADIRIRWKLDVVGKDAGKDMLRTDRALRKAVESTDKAMTARARRATASGKTVARAVEAERKATERAQKAIQGAARAQTQMGRASTTAAGQVRVSSRAVTDQARAYERSGAAARRAADQQVSAARRSSRAATDAARQQRTQMSKGAAGGAATAGGLAGGALSRGAGLAGAAGLGFGLASATGDAVGFEKQMANVQARLLTTTENMRKLSDFALKLGANTQFSGREAAGAMDELAAQGFSVREIFQTLPGTLNLAAASGTDLATAAMIQTAALRGFGLEAGKAGHVADVLAQTTNKSAVDMADLGEMLPYVASTARQTGTSLEQTAAAAGILGNAGIKGSMAGTALRTSMLRLTDPTAKMEKRFKAMGIEASDLAAMPLPRVIGRVAEGLKKLPTRGEKVGAISAIFGKEAAPAMLNLMAEGRKGIDKLTDSLTKSRGAAKRSADIMRNTVSGAWDNFTGSVETASVKLGSRFLPKLKDVLNLAAGGVNKLPTLLGAIGAGAAGEEPTRTKTVIREGRGGRPIRTQVEVPDESKLAGVGQKIGQVARTVGTAAIEAGKQLLDAFKPALPFFQNVLLPLLEGVGKGILTSVVAAFKVAVPVIKAVATVLGVIGKAAAPLRPVIKGLGVVLSFVFGGLILKGIGLLGKLGAGLRLLLTPFRLLFGLIAKLGPVLRGAIGVFAAFGGKVGGVARSIGRTISGGFSRAWRTVRTVFSAGGRAIVSVLKVVTAPARAAAGLIGRAIVAGFRVVRTIAGTVRNAFGSVVDTIRAVPGRIASVASGMFNGIKEAFRSAINFIIRGWNSLNFKIPGFDPPGPGPSFGGATIGLPHINELRRGGRARRFAGGGLVEAMVSPGELMIDPGGHAWPVPGSRTAADNVHVTVPNGTAVITGHGQGLMASGASVGDALRWQLPHFQDGGIAGLNKRFPEHGLSNAAGHFQMTERGVRAAAENAKFSAYRAAVMAKVVNRESTRYPGIVASDKGTGLNQITNWAWPSGSPLHPHLQRLGGMPGMRNPLRNMDMAYVLAGYAQREAGNWLQPWSASSTPAIANSVPRKVKSVLDGHKFASGARTRLSFASGLPSSAAAVSGGFEAGQAGTSLAGAIGEIVTGATARLKKQKQTATTRRRRSGSPDGFQPGGGWAGTKNLVMHAVRGIDQGMTFKRSTAINGNQNSDHNTWIKNAFAADISPGGDSVFSMIAKRLGIGAQKGSWNTFSNKPLKGFRSQLLWHAPDGSHTDHVHLGIRALRRGGLLGRFQGGGTAGHLKGGFGPGKARRAFGMPPAIATLARLGTKENDAAKAALRELADAIEQVDDITASILRQRLRDIRAEARKLERGGVTKRERPARRALRREATGIREDLSQERSPLSFARLLRVETGIGRQIRRVERGGVSGQGERVQMRRLQAAQRIVQTEMGRRLGLVTRAVEKQATSLERARNALSRSLRIQGIDEASAAGVAALRDLAAVQLGQLKSSEASLQRALTRAKRLGDRAAVEAIGDQLAEVQETLADAYVSWIEQVRAAIAAAAQEQVDLSQFGVEVAQGALSGLEIAQRLNRTEGTPAGMVQRSQAIQATLLPALQANQTALAGQVAALTSIGDVPGARAAQTALQQAGNEIASALAEAADLLREAALQAAQEAVNLATHETTMSSLQLARLELEQRIAGTFESGGVARAELIRTQIIPDLEAELSALRSQAATAAAQGDPELARQIAEAIASKQNEILEQTLAATEQVAANTEQRAFGGTLGWTFGNETVTDAIIAVGSGA